MLWDGEYHPAKMVMVVAMGLSYLKDSPEYEIIKRESICLRGNIYSSVRLSPALAFLMFPSFLEWK